MRGEFITEAQPQHQASKLQIEERLDGKFHVILTGSNFRSVSFQIQIPVYILSIFTKIFNKI